MRSPVRSRPSAPALKESTMENKNKKKIEDNTDVQKNEYYDIIATEDCFEVEDPDPDKRSWYYDSYGIKRKKK